MSAITVIDDHKDLVNIGDLTHEEIDNIILNGDPGARTIDLALLSADNVFTGTNTFGAYDESGAFPDPRPDVYVLGDLYVSGTRYETTASNLSVEDVIIVLGKDAAGPALNEDRGFIFTAADTNPAFYWDHTESEFRLARLTSGVGTIQFPDPDALGQGGYADFRVGDLVAASLLTPSISVGELLTEDGSQNYLERYVKSGSGITVAPDLADPGSLKISINRQKESNTPGSILPAGELFSSAIITGMNNVTPQNLDVLLNGVMLTQGMEYDYIIELNQGIKFSFTLESDDIVTVIGY